MSVRTRRFQGAGVTESKADRRIILRHFVEDFVGKGLPFEPAIVRLSEPARNLHRSIGFRAIIHMPEIILVLAAAPHPRSAVRVPREVVQRCAP